MRHAAASARRQRHLDRRGDRPLTRHECLDLVLDRIPIVLWSLTRTGRIAMCDGHGLALLERTSAELVGSSFFDLIGDEEAVKADLRDRLAAGRAIMGTHRLGSRWHELYLASGADGAATTSVRGVSVDVTERWLAGRAQLEAESRLRTVLDHSPMILWAIDAAGRITLAEGKGLAAVGLTPSTAIGVSISELLDDEMLRVFQTVLDGVPFEGETHTARPPLHHQTSCEPLRDAEGRNAGAIVVSIDITERKRVEEERDRMLRAARRALAGERAARRRATFLEQASRVLAGSLDQTTTLLSIVHLVVPEIADGCVVHVLGANGTHERPVVAYRDPAREPELAAIAARADAEHRHVSWSLIDDGDVVFAPRLVGSELESKLPAGVRRDLVETMRVVSLTVLGLEAHGRDVGLLCLFTAEESGRELERDDVELASDLAVHAALAIDNARLYAEQTTAVQRRDDFLSVASHELRTPVTSIQLAIQALVRREEREVTTEARSVTANMLHTAERQSKRLAQLVENLLDVSRIATGQLTMCLEPVDLTELTREAVAGLGVEATQAGCTVDLDLPLPVTGMWDRVRLEQVVVNLLSNALKYGGGRPVALSVRAEGDRARLVVEDHGIGIPRAAQATIFDRFERAVSARHFGGFGLGLFIVKQIVTALGGEISVESEEGAGAKFTVLLPLSNGSPGDGK